ncbi:MAG: SLBB domain-containing protein [Ignavibacteria bacterium]|nr:SLBB domain-containing protein [Ignavibacteria bacterium]
MKYLLGSVLFFLIFGLSFSQDDDDNLILGNSQNNKSAALYDLSDPTGVNIEVNLWGYVRLPGRYRVPIKTTFMDLMSYAGGPIDESNLKEIRIIRNSNVAGKTAQLIKLDYDDLLWDEKVSTKPRSNPVLEAGDVVIILKEKRYTFREDLSLYIPIFTTLISIATFIITLTNN